jgi:hypothetical protein
MVVSPFQRYVMAVERVEKRLRRVTKALNEAGVRYAVIGGNAVAVWVAKADPSATRSTVDIDLLVDHGDLPAITNVFGSLGFARHDSRRLTLFTDPDEPSRRSGVHLVWAGRKVLPSYAHAAPNLDEAVFEPVQGFWVLDLPALVRMKLTSFRDIDRVHIADMLSIGLIDDAARAALPEDLNDRFGRIQAGLDDSLGR